MERTNERKPYESPAVVYEAIMEVHAAPNSVGEILPADIFDPAKLN